MLTLIALAPLVAIASEKFTGKAVGLTDGDTIKVMREGKPKSIRLVGIDCPESGQAFGQKAKQFTADLCAGKEATIEWSERDRYGRIPAKVTVGQTNFNRELAKAGMAWQFKRYNMSKELADRVASARNAKALVRRDTDFSVGLAVVRGGPEVGQSNSTQPKPNLPKHD